MNESKGSRITLLGIGDGASLAIAHFEKNFSMKIKTIALIFTQEMIAKVTNIKTMFVGTTMLKEKASESQPLKVMEALKEDILEIKKIVSNTDILILVATLGGRTGTVGIEFVLNIALEMKVVTIPIVTLPFKFEGKKCKNIALQGLQNIQRKNNCTVVIKNDDLLAHIQREFSLEESFHKVDQMISDVISDTIAVNNIVQEMKQKNKQLQSLQKYSNSSVDKLMIKFIQNNCNSNVTDADIVNNVNKGI